MNTTIAHQLGRDTETNILSPKTYQEEKLGLQMDVQISSEYSKSI